MQIRGPPSGINTRILFQKVLGGLVEPDEKVVFLDDGTDGGDGAVEEGVGGRVGEIFAGEETGSGLAGPATDGFFGEGVCPGVVKVGEMFEYFPVSGDVYGSHLVINGLEDGFELGGGVVWAENTWVEEECSGEEDGDVRVATGVGKGVKS